MKRVYESFAELAEVMTAGEGMLHRRHCPFKGSGNDAVLGGPPDLCDAWQDGVKHFAAWLDQIVYEPVEVSDDRPRFYDFDANEPAKKESPITGADVDRPFDGGASAFFTQEPSS